jgi:hypothetical protein
MLPRGHGGAFRGLLALSGLGGRLPWGQQAVVSQGVTAPPSGQVEYVPIPDSPEGSGAIDPPFPIGPPPRPPGHTITQGFSGRDAAKHQVTIARGMTFGDTFNISRALLFPFSHIRSPVVHPGETNGLVLDIYSTASHLGFRVTPLPGGPKGVLTFASTPEVSSGLDGRVWGPKSERFLKRHRPTEGGG